MNTLDPTLVVMKIALTRERRKHRFRI